ncbi:MerR family transcriptional regulator [Catellatospora sp. NPDC049111]|uniref:MerR family transcriptional regulator n=1 Tax=Catellatospora sp. NPDC049111 TaxID=3155271 RepID=UPI0033EE2BA0
MIDELADGEARNLLTIGQLADYAGVTIKAVRHYHERDLLPEPSRDGSGYRRYGARHAVQLIKIKTLAEAGVPLARVRELLAADPAAFTEAIGEVERDVRDHIDRLHRTLDRIARLRAGDRLFVSEQVADYLDRLRALGVGERTVHLERDLWIMMQALSPQTADGWLTDKLDALDDPQFQDIYRDYDAAYGWSPDDPRLPELARRSRRWYDSRQPTAEAGLDSDPEIVALAAAAAAAASPAWARLGQLTQQADGPL